MGIVSGSYHGPAAALIARTFGARVRGTAMGIHITGGHLSFFAAPALAGLLATTTGTWRTPYLLFAAAPVVLAALLWIVAPRKQGSSPSGDPVAAVREISYGFPDARPDLSPDV